MAGLAEVGESRRLVLVNNRARLEALYREHRRYAVRYIARRVEPEHQHVVEDLAQETFLKAWPGLHRVRVRDESSWRRWISAVARYRVSSYYRADRPNAAGRHGAETPVSPGSPLWWSPALADESVATATDAVEDRVTLAAALSRLPAPTRQVLELRFLHGLTRDALAQRTRYSNEKIARLTSEGLAALRVMLGAQPGVPAAGTPEAKARARKAVDEARQWVANQQRPECVQEALASLPPDIRQALELRVLEGMTVTGTARRMRRTERTVLKLTHEGLAAVRELLTQVPVQPAAPAKQHVDAVRDGPDLGQPGGDPVARAQAAVAACQRRAAQAAQTRIRRAAGWQAEAQATGVGSREDGAGRDTGVLMLGGAA